MKTIRSNKYRRKRRRSDRFRLLRLLAIIGGAVVLAAAAAAVCLVLFLPTGSSSGNDGAGEDVSSAMQTSSESAGGAADSEAAKINPNAATAATSGALAYQSLYPEMYVPIVEKIPAPDGANVVYLTFDDGPSILTEELLDILDEAGVKATFFVTCQGETTSEDLRLLAEIADRGHAIGIHTYTHDYTKIYASVESFLEDFSKMNDVIYEATGEYPTMFRFAGGSYNSYNLEVYQDIIDEMKRRGYTYFDWNVDSCDSESNATEKSIYENAVTGITSHNKSIVLMHNSGAKTATLNQVGAIIKAAKKAGYHFDVLDPSVKPFSFAEPE